MKPNDSFFYLKNNQVHQDLVSLSRYYLPLMGEKALATYAYFLAFQDQGETSHQFSEALNHLNFGMVELEGNLATLSALNLLDLYQLDTGYYQLVLKSPMDGPRFFQHQVLTRTLERKIGEPALLALKPNPVTGSLSLKKSLTDLFSVDDAPAFDMQEPAQNDFDLHHFKQLMARDNLRFKDEKTDVFALFEYAERGKKTWFDTYQEAKRTALGQVISTKRLLKTLELEPTPVGEFSQAEKSLLAWAKNRKALEFLADLKERRQASITAAERQLLKQVGQLGLLDPVINVAVFYTLQKLDSANLNETYFLKLANDLSYKKIHSAEAALTYLSQDRTKDQGAPSQSPNKAKSQKTNIPDWSKESYRTEATPEELERLEALRRRMMGDKEV